MHYSYCGTGLSVGTMIAGWDEMVYSSSKSVLFFSCLTWSLSSWEPGLYYVDSEGGSLKVTHFSVGSGKSMSLWCSGQRVGIRSVAVFCHGSLKAINSCSLSLSYHYDTTLEEAAELACRAIYHATFHDGASGMLISFSQLLYILQLLLMINFLSSLMVGSFSTKFL